MLPPDEHAKLVSSAKGHCSAITESVHVFIYTRVQPAVFHTHFVDKNLQVFVLTVCTDGELMRIFSMRTAPCAWIGGN